MTKSLPLTDKLMMDDGDADDGAADVCQEHVTQKDRSPDLRLCSLLKHVAMAIGWSRLVQDRRARVGIHTVSGQHIRNEVNLSRCIFSLDS